MGKHPFEIYIAPHEIATGPMVEMSGKFLGGLFVMQCFQIYTVGVLYTTLFLGGGENWLTFLLKAFAVVAIPDVRCFCISALPHRRHGTADVEMAGLC